MASQGGLMNFPIRTRDKESSWSSKYDGGFHDYIDAGPVSNLESPYADTLHPTSSFDELFDDLFDSSSPQTHSSETSEIKLLTEPYPALQHTEDFWTKTLDSFVNSPHENTSHVTSESPPTLYSVPLVERHQFAPTGIPSPPYAPASSAQFEEPRGRTRTGAQQDSSRRTRNPSGVRKSLRHTKSTPNMMNQARYKPSLEGLWSQAQLNAPPVPLVDKKWMCRQPPSPPTSTETNDCFAPRSANGLYGTETHSLTTMHDFLDPSLVPHSAVHTPLASPLPDATFSTQADNLWTSGYNEDAVAFNNTDFFSDDFSLQGRRRSFGEPTPPSFNLWTKANATSPAPLDLNAAALRSVPAQAVVSAPIFRPGEFGHGFPSSYAAQALMSPQPQMMVDANISPRTMTFNTHAPNFSLPYRSQTATSNQRDNVRQPLRPVHHRATSELPVNQPDAPSPRRTRSSSRLQSAKHHHRSKSGPAPLVEAGSAPRPTRSKESRGGGMAGFVNLTPDDSQKLLTGVAPSGSSKTKARREKEAMEKRRRLSQAAVKAVREGDLGALREVGLVVEDA